MTGKITASDEKPIAGVTIRIVNQTTSAAKLVKTRVDGSYSVRLGAGAYRIAAESPFEARFDRGRVVEYGAFSNVICDETKKLCPVLENVIVGGDAERKIDFQVVSTETPPAGGMTAATAQPKAPESREMPDRWRIGFPEYDRYGDKGARGRDIPFRAIAGTSRMTKTFSRVINLFSATIIS